MNTPSLVMVLLMLTGFGASQTAPGRNRIEGAVVGRSGNNSKALSGIRVYLLDLSDHEQDSTITDKLGKFSMIAPVELKSFRLLFDDDSDEYWRKRDEFSNSSHPHDIGQEILYSVTQALNRAEAAEQQQLASVLAHIDPERGKILLGRVATDYPQLFDGRCAAAEAVWVPSRMFVPQAVPNLLNSRMTANESSAVAAIRTINTAQITYSATYPENGYADTLEKLGPGPASGVPSSSNAGLIDSSLASGKKLGYSFHLSANHEKNVSLQLRTVRLKTSPITAYQIVACPVEPSVSGHYSFFSDQTGEINRLGIGHDSDPKTTIPK